MFKVEKATDILTGLSDDSDYCHFYASFVNL